MVDGRYVPEGTTVGVHQYAAYHCERNFVRPDCFVPERWLEGKDEERSEWRDDDRAVFNPFSVGPRNCIGRYVAFAFCFFWLLISSTYGPPLLSFPFPLRCLPSSYKIPAKDPQTPTNTRFPLSRNLAYAEMRLVMARMLWTFDLALDETAHPDDVITTNTTTETENAKVGEEGPGAWQSQQRVFLIWEKRPLMVKLRVREGLGGDDRDGESGFGGGAGAGGGQGRSSGALGSVDGSSSSVSGSGVMPMGSTVVESAAWSA